MAAPVLSHFEKPITLSVNGIAIDEFGDPLPRISIVIRQGGVTIDSTSSSELGGVEFNNVRGCMIRDACPLEGRNLSRPAI